MSFSIEFKPNIEKIIESILYLTHKKELTRYQIVKFFYLGDREHLRRYGRPITFDHYVAMENGPVASLTYDILKGKNVLGIKSDELPFELGFVGQNRGAKNPTRNIKNDLFSKSDFKTLDEIFEKYSESTFQELWELTHTHASYKNAWENNKSASVPMAFEDFFDDIENKDSIVEEIAFISRGM